MSAVGRRRLLVLADFLERGDLREGKFAMSHWSVNNKLGVPKLGDCGTAACALGWATMIPSFRRAGLHLGRYGEPVITDGEHPLDAAETLFGINQYEADSLFIPDDADRLKGARGRKIVAGRIRKLVARLEKEAS